MVKQMLCEQEIQIDFIRFHSYIASVCLYVSVCESRFSALCQPLHTNHKAVEMDNIFMGLLILMVALVVCESQHQIRQVLSLLPAEKKIYIIYINVHTYIHVYIHTDHP